MTARRTSLALAALLALAPAAFAEDAPYAGQDARDIASLSASDIEALTEGQGWGLALPAELNGYPGPLHVLELATELELTEAQRTEVQAIFDAMRAEAQAKGAAYIEAEAHLSRMFRAGYASPERLQMMLDEAGEALAALRQVHLSAHLQVTPLLSEGQRETYAALRGYGGADGQGAGHSGSGAHSGH